MKENLKIKRSIRENNIEAMDLFNEIGLTIQSNCFAYLYADNNGFHGDRIDYEEITLPELRELAREKEYLNDKFELVVTNQPLDGWILVPDGAEFLTPELFWKDGDMNHLAYGASSIGWYRGSLDLEDYLNKQKYKILWQREKKVETVEGRFFHQEWAEKYVSGIDLIWQGTVDNEWRDFDGCDFSLLKMNHIKFRLKPQKIQIGSRTINKPISVKPEIGAVVYVSSVTQDEKYLSISWDNSLFHLSWLNRNLCHLTAADAINHTDALLELME